MKRSHKVIIIGAAALVLLMGTTQPSHVPSLVLMVPFVILFVILSTAAASLLGWGQGGPTAKTLRTGAFIAALPMLLLVLQSLGQLTLRDVATILILFSLTYFYISKIKASTTS